MRWEDIRCVWEEMKKNRLYENKILELKNMRQEEMKNGRVWKEI